MDRRLKIINGGKNKKISPVQDKLNRYHSIFENANDLILYMNNNGIILDVNNKVTKITGFSKKELIGNPFSNYIIAEDKSKCLTVFERIYSGEHVEGIELEIKRKKGEAIPLEFNSSPIKIDSQEIEVICVGRDISYKKKVERDIAYLAGITENSHDAIASLDLDGVFTSWNRGAEEIFGYTKDDIIGKSFGYIVPEELKHTCFDLLDTACEKGFLKGVETERIAKDGKLVPVEMTISPLYDSGHKQTGYTFIMRDITGRRMAEEKLRQNEEKFRNLFQNSNDGILLHDMEGKIIDINQVALFIFGYKRSEIVGLNIQDLHPPGNLKKSKEAFREVSKHGLYNFEISYKTKGGKIFPAEVSSSMVEIGGKKVIQEVVRDITERKDAEEALVYLAGITENSHDAIASLDLDGVFTSWNKGAEEILGYTKEDVIGESFGFIVPQELKHTCYDLLEAACEKGFLKGIETDRIAKDGRKVPVEMTLSPLFDSHNNQIGYTFIMRDITEKKEAQNSLKNKSEFLTSILNNMTEGLTVINRNYYIKEVNKAAVELAGLKKEDIIGKKCHLISHGSNKRCSGANDICPAEKVFETGEPIRVTHKHFSHDGKESYIELTASPITDSEGNVVSVLEISDDVTQRKKAERDLAFLAGISENSHDAIASLDMDGVFNSWNKGAEEILGYTKEEIIGKSFGYIVPDELKHTCFDLLETACERGFLRGVETDRIAKDGRSVPVEMTISPLYDIRSNQIGYTFIMRDITERKIMEMNLVKRQEKLIKLTREMEKKNAELEESNSLKDLFSDIMRHDLLNPAGIIKSYTEFAMELNPDDEDLPIIYKNSNKLINLLEKATIYSRLENGTDLDKVNTDLKEIITNLCDDLMPIVKEADMDLEIKIDGQMPISVNPMIGEIFINFISNAVKYANEGKKIIVETENNEDYYIIMIKDFGPGIPDEYKDSMFDRFKRMKKEAVKGTGLGLAIAKRMADLHNAKIWIEDNEPNGSVFVVQLPKDQVLNVEA